jgi:Xaa-Pro dipeptidase
MSNVFFERQDRLFKQLSAAGIFAAVLKDFEGSKNSSIRYLTGHPQDSVLFIFCGIAKERRGCNRRGTQGATLLLPWDINLAKENAYCTEIIPYTDFNRNFSNAVVSIFAGNVPPSISKYLKTGSAKTTSGKEKIEFSGASSLLEIKSLKKLLPNKNIVCKETGIDLILSQNRMIKDESEISIYREAAKITNNIIDKLEKFVKKSLQKPSAKISEIEIALLIEKLARESGAEGTGFKTLVAGHERSWAIHPYPTFSSSPVSKTGTTIVDFGIKYKGYTTDVTITFVGKNPTGKQKEIINLVSEAAGRAEKLLKPGTFIKSLAEDINVFFEQYGYSMPHSPGHGIGLDVHEAPVLRISNEARLCLQEGMILAIEPGLYDPLHGGVRLENDYVITKTGCEKITNARIIFL